MFPERQLVRQIKETSIRPGEEIPALRAPFAQEKDFHIFTPAHIHLPIIWRWMVIFKISEALSISSFQTSPERKLSPGKVRFMR